MNSCCVRNAMGCTLSHQGFDDGDECGGDQGCRSACFERFLANRPSSRSVKKTDVIFDQCNHRRPCQLCYRPDILEPRPSNSRSGASCTWQQKFLRSIEDLYGFWKKFCEDPFRWEIVKSAVWFALGLRLFTEMRSKDDVRNRERNCIENVSLQPDLLKDSLLTYNVITCDFENFDKIM